MAVTLAVGGCQRALSQVDRNSNPSVTIKISHSFSSHGFKRSLCLQERRNERTRLQDKGGFRVFSPSFQEERECLFLCSTIMFHTDRRESSLHGCLQFSFHQIINFHIHDTHNVGWRTRWRKVKPRRNPTTTTMVRSVEPALTSPIACDFNTPLQHRVQWVPLVYECSRNKMVIESHDDQYYYQK